MPRQSVDLLEICKQAARNLEEAAKAGEFTVSIQGEPIRIMGVQRLIYEVVYNLCENAIKYNVPGGSVRLRVQCCGNEA